MQNAWTSLLWFGAVLALIPLVLWLLKRSPMGAGLSGGTANGRSAQRGLPRTVAVLPLSAQHKLVTVEVGQGEDRQWLVLAMSPQGLQSVHTMRPGEKLPEPASAPPQAAFAQLLGRMRSGSLGPNGSSA